ncbi:hypothetical protein EA767_13165 [Acinetobacter pittii]|nr:hypothetical protein EA767_13165 [Acinetobacter pittii]WHA52165.1 hypothetical protein OH685_02755 [Acinetobacter pittii]
MVVLWIKLSTIRRGLYFKFKEVLLNLNLSIVFEFKTNNLDLENFKFKNKVESLNLKHGK